MNSNPIKIGRTRSCFFTKIQKNKLETGIQIFSKALKQIAFEEGILQFNWTNQQNKRFHRFYHANGLSNRQILDRLQKYPSYLEELGLSSQLVLLPFNNRKDIQAYNATNRPIIWISVNCIHNDWYTPVHIASTICHELCSLLDLDSSIHQISKPEYKRYSVPTFLGHLMMETAALWKDSISDIGSAFDKIDTEQYNYFPASTSLGNIYTRSNLHTQENFESLISTLLTEQENLIALQEKLTSSETTRLICIEEVLLKLNVLKAKLANCSLDGSEFDFQLNAKSSGGSRSNSN